MAPDSRAGPPDSNPMMWLLRLSDDLVAGVDVNLDGDLVAHGPRRQEQARFLAEQLRHPVLQPDGGSGRSPAAHHRPPLRGRWPASPRSAWSGCPSGSCAILASCPDRLARGPAPPCPSVLREGGSRPFCGSILYAMPVAKEILPPRLRHPNPGPIPPQATGPRTSTQRGLRPPGHRPRGLPPGYHLGSFGADRHPSDRQPDPILDEVDVAAGRAGQVVEAPCARDVLIPAPPVPRRRASSCKGPVAGVGTRSRCPSPTGSRWPRESCRNPTARRVW